MKLSFILTALLLASACGLAENEQDEKDKYIYLSIADLAFRDYCLAEFDLNRDGKLSRYEAKRARNMNCSNRGIATMWEIGEFVNLATLDCSNNRLADLDLRRCVMLQNINCGLNNIGLLDVSGLLALTALDCSANALTTLNLGSNSALSRLDCRKNNFTMLDVSVCARYMERLDATQNSSLATLVILRGQTFGQRLLDAATTVSER